MNVKDERFKAETRSNKVLIHQLQQQIESLQIKVENRDCLLNTNQGRASEPMFRGQPSNQLKNENRELKELLIRV